VSIASGFACGVFASFTPFLGLHFLVAGALALIVRGNIIASAIGTFFGNPWSFVPIWLASYEIGFSLLRRFGGISTSSKLTVEELLSVMGDLAWFFSFSGKITWMEVQLGIKKILTPLLLGGICLGSFAWVVSFTLAFFAVKAWREHRSKRLVKAFKGNKKTRL